MDELLEQYRILDVTASTSWDQLKQAYKDLVLVWHPDRFCGHPRLQRKAEEKLKLINLAYQKLSESHRLAQRSAPSNQGADPSQPHGGQDRRSPPRSARPGRRHSRPQQAPPRSPSSCPSAGGAISFAQAEFVIQTFPFLPLQSDLSDRRHYKSGPFWIESVPERKFLKIMNLCDSINGFHPILLWIPCKTSGIFLGHEAEQLIGLLPSP
ncbi:J domain-containing protein [Lyngbya confervoides]|uniref:J domain-containing protein n=1 Tax=Lyngbya confervoides BDU141951 TaxID=1574623 RepID=A0ABD4T284_9CYAN|nr:J domain-containing protein [Lyngbya confervoides]MCM1982687.1 J domain-containing protein [Lyngbya confervoides BDU141951]